MKFYHIKSCHGDFFGFNKENHSLSLYHEQEEGRDFEPVIGFTSDKFPDLIFLFPKKSKAEKFKLTQSSFTNNIYPFYIKGADNDHYHFINTTLSDSPYVSCIPCSWGWAADGRWHTGGMPYLWLEDHPHDWTKNSLEPLQEEEILPCYQEFSSLIEHYFTITPTEKTINDILFAPITQEDRLSLLNLLLPFLPSEIVQKFASKFLHDQNYLRILEEKIPQDFWIEKSLKPLLSWVHSGRPVNNFHHVNEEYDFLHVRDRERETPSFLEELNRKIRYLIKPRHRACIVTTMRNEGLYILPWITWHKQLGFEHFFIYSNENDDGSDEILRILAEQGIITWIKNDVGRGVKTQFKILKHAFTIFPEVLNYEWSFVCDVDEYLQFNKKLFSHLNPFLDRFNTYPTDGIKFHWRIVTAEDKIDYKDADIAERNNFYLNNHHTRFFKMMGKTAHLIGANAHICLCAHRENWTYRFPSSHKIVHHLSDTGIPQSNDDFSIAYLLHYYMRSSKEFLLRLYRGDVIDPYRNADIDHGMFLKYDKIRVFNELYNNITHEIPEEERPINDASKQMLHELMELPGMREAKENVMSITSHRIEQLLTYLRENVEDLGEDWQLFLKNFEENCG